MPRIAIINIGAHGHINPTLPVAGELKRRGAEVLYFAPEEFRAAVAAEGVELAPYDSLFGRATPAAGTPTAELMAQMPARLSGECLHTLPEIEPRLLAFKPDLVIYNKFCLSARLLTHEHGIKAATFLPSYASNEHFNLTKIALKNGVAPPPHHPALLQFSADAEQLERRFKVKLAGLADLFGHTEGLNICFVARAFQYEGQSFDARFVFVGPSIAPRPTAGEWQRSADGRPLVFVSLGTVFNGWPEFFKLGFDAFAEQPWRVVMAVGKRVDPAALGQRPKNVELAEHVPQLEVLEQTSVFVTHGGMNSAMESLWFGVPMVVVPQMAEQAATAQRVAELGLGHAFTRESLTTNGLRDAVTDLMSNQAVRGRIAAMQKEVRSAGGQVKAAEAILKYVTA